MAVLKLQEQKEEGESQSGVLVRGWGCGFRGGWRQRYSHGGGSVRKKLSGWFLDVTSRLSS